MRDLFLPFVLAVSVTPIAGCDASSASTAGSGWKAQLASLGRTGQGVYSFRFDGAPPSGAYYRLGIHAAPAATACSRYQGSAASNDDFWFLAVDIDDLDLGEHSITLEPRQGVPSPTANVDLLHRANESYAETYPAVGGTLSITQAPSVDAARGGGHLMGHMEADFPTRALSEVVCQGGQAARSDAAPTMRCICKNPEGGTTTCTPTSDMPRCCEDLKSPTTRVVVDFDAAPCSAMCAEVEGLPDYCQSA